MDGIPLVFGCIDHRATILGSHGDEAVFYGVPWNIIGHELRWHLFEFHGIQWNNGPMEFQDLIVFHGSSHQEVFHGIP